MKTFLLLVLTGITGSSLAQRSSPEQIEFDRFPSKYWQLTLITRHEFIERSSPGFEHFTRKQCVEDGVRRMVDQIDLPPAMDDMAYIGFVCEVVERE